MIYSPLQTDIFDFALTQKDSLIIESVAGSGKTTTSKETVRRLASQKLTSHKEDYLNPFTAFKEADFLAIAFNKHIAEVWKKELPANCDASTIHSHSYSICRAQLGSREVDRYGKKIDTIMTQLGIPDPWKIKGDDDTKEEAKRIRYSISSIVSICKATLTHDQPAEMPNVCNFYGVYVYDTKAFAYATEILERCMKNTTLIDYDDMCWLPVVMGCNIPTYECVLVDEQQDMNTCQNELIKRMNSRIIAVGDRHQSLYGFRGADPSSMDNLKTALNAKELPLSISYRCPRSVVELAQTLVPQIQARDGAPEGDIIETTEDKFLSKVRPGDMIVCRYNAPLITIALDLIADGVKVKVRGRDIGKSIATFAAKFCKSDNTSSQALGSMSDFVKRELAKPGSRTHKQNIIDKAAVTKIFINKCPYPSFVPDAIADLFSEDKCDITLSSIHRAKGDEADNVFVREVEPAWLKNVTLQPHEQQQENNCKYVAWTRAKEKLYFVRDQEEIEMDEFYF